MFTELPGVYPIPASHRIFLDQIADTTPILLRNMEGQVVMSGCYSSDGIDVSALAEGFYILVWQPIEGQKTFLRKMLVAK